MPLPNVHGRSAELVDWRFLYPEPKPTTAPRGSPRSTRSPFSTPVLVGRLENLVRDRRLIEHGAVRLDDEVDEALPSIPS
ncbi:hypothetical protein MTX78_14510 [Hymenobacter tibetensis]|uniref:Uncharacterized protein n=1 Tax=Hymenobacter tibetensis TaxID=497967 RepID=A0ABY4CVY2_9BACT|nr:hypothetical protein [Hymenobacter tibetensis]UOG73335.1 hypothetical protein MTX78_14510 [Hymenobacter tibetensis]